MCAKNKQFWKSALHDDVKGTDSSPQVSDSTPQPAVYYPLLRPPVAAPLE